MQLVLLTLAASAVAYARTAISPLQETIRHALLLSDNQIALLQGPALALPVVLGSIPLGLAIDRYSRSRLLLIFAVLSVIGSFLTAIATHFSVLFLARALVGFTVTATSTTAVSLLADLFAPAQRGRASMVVVVGQYGGFSAAFALGGALLGLSDAGSDSWRWAMLWLTAPLAVVALLVLGIREPIRGEHQAEQTKVRQSFIALWRVRSLVFPVLAGIIVADMAVMAVLTWASPTLTRGFNLSPARVGAIMAAVVMVSGVLGSIMGGVVADLCQKLGGPRRTMAALGGLALLSVPLGLFPLLADVKAASVLLTLYMTIVGAIIVMATALFTIAIPKKLRGLCLGASAGAGVLFGIGLAPLTVSLLSDAIGGPMMIGVALATVCVATGLLGATTFVLGRNTFPAKVAAESESD